MENGAIKDDQITSSSVRYDIVTERFFASNGRLNAVPYKRWSAWIPLRVDPNNWLQVDLLVNARVSAILTQGRYWPTLSHWVKQYSVSYGIDAADSLKVYKENGVRKASILTFKKQFVFFLSFLSKLLSFSFILYS